MRPTNPSPRHLLGAVVHRRDTSGHGIEQLRGGDVVELALVEQVADIEDVRLTLSRQWCVVVRWWVTRHHTRHLVGSPDLLWPPGALVGVVP